MLKLRVTGAAAAKVVFPAWLAKIEHCPAATGVTIAPETVHTEGMLEAKLTERPELALALIVNGGADNVTSASGPNTIACANLTKKLSVTGVATAYIALPF